MNETKYITNERLGVGFREMKKGDLVSVYEIETDCYSTAWPMKAFEDALDNLESFVLYMVCNDDVVTGLAPDKFPFKSEGAGVVDDIVGFFIGGGVEDEYNIYNIAIKPTYHKKGYGWYLLNTVIDGHFKRYENYFLEVRRSNNAAIALYYKFGFRFVYERRNYYSEPVEDALVMKYGLSGA